MVSTLRSALVIAKNDLHRRLRNRSFVIQAIFGPLVLALVISAAFSGGFGFDVKIGVASLDESEVADGIRAGLIAGQAEGVEFVAFDDLDAAERAVDDDDIGAVLVIPAGFEESLARPTTLALGVLTKHENVVPGAVAQAVAQGIAARVQAGRLTAVSLASIGEVVPSPDELADLDLPIAIEERSPGEELSPAATVAPGMGLLFLFFTVATVSRSLLDERRQRVLDRMLAAPLTLTAVLLGKAITVVVLGVASLGTLWLATTVLFDAAWGDSMGVAVLLGAATLAIAGISAVVAAVASNEQSADLIATAVAFILGILGGSLVPLSELPDELVRVSLFTPNGWAQRGLAELSAGNGNLSDVLPEAGVLLVWAAVALAVAAVFLPRRLASR